MPRSAGFLVHGVRAVPPAVLFQFNALAVIHLVLRGDVVPALAHLTFQGDGDALVV